MQASAAGAGTALLAGCGGGSRPPLTAAARASDVVLLNRALAIEQRSIALYTAGGPLLSGQAKQVARRFLAQDLRHAGRLRSLLKQAHAKPHDPDAHYDFAQPHSEAELLAQLHKLERQQIAAYLHAIPRISVPALRQTLASIMANDAQHLIMLRGQLGLSPLAGPFLTVDE